MNKSDFQKINVRNLPMVFFPQNLRERLPPTDFFIYDMSHIAFAKRVGSELWIFDSLGHKNARCAKVTEFFNRRGIKMRYMNKFNFQQNMTSDTCAIYAVLFSLKIVRRMSDWKLKKGIKPMLRNLKIQTAKIFGSSHIISKESQLDKVLSLPCIPLNLLVPGSKLALIRMRS